MLRQLNRLVIFVDLEDATSLEVLDSLQDDRWVDWEFLDRLVLEQICVGSCDAHKWGKFKWLAKLIFIRRHGRVYKCS